MNPSEIKQIIEAVCSTDIKKFKYVNNGVKIEIDRNAGGTGLVATDSGSGHFFHGHAFKSADGGEANPSNVSNPSYAAPVAAPVHVAVVEAPVASETTEVIASPIVGVFYASPTPESASYAAVGQFVKKGDILCIVEAMKVMNEITAEYDLRVVEVMAANEQLVEFGQPLFKVERQ